MKHPASYACRSTGLVVLALVLGPALGCGDENIVANAPPAASPPAASPPVAPPLGIADEREPLEIPLQGDVRAKGVARMLTSYCVDCHGDASEGGLDRIGDLVRQIALGNIVPGAAAQSPLVQRIVDGSMPPPRRVRPTPGELAILTGFIDQLPAAPATACEKLPFQSTDAVYAALLADVTSAPVQARPFLRYVGLTYASNAGWCGEALERQRLALFKGINGASLAHDVIVPRAIDEHGLLYRIDLRDYRWDRSIAGETEGSTPYADGWAAIVASAGAYALELQGVEADELKRETGTLVPYLPAHALLHAAAGQAYLGLLGLPATFYDAEVALGIDLDADIFNGLVQHAGYSNERADYVARRFEQGAHPGRYYWMLDAWYGSRSASPYEDPFSFGRDAPFDALFHLPNGLLAYNFDESYSSTLGFANRHSPASEAVACNACHQAGILPVTDVVRSVVEANRTLYDSETFADVLQSYPLQPELDALIASDNQLYASALEQAGLSPSSPDPLSYVYQQFELDRLSLTRVAAELSVTPDELLAQLPQLDPRLQVLQEPDGNVPRSVLEEAYAPSWCILQEAARNRPVSCP